MLALPAFFFLQRLCYLEAGVLYAAEADDDDADDEGGSSVSGFAAAAVARYRTIKSVRSSAWCAPRAKFSTASSTHF
jgi:hypothetical protein